MSKDVWERRTQDQSLLPPVAETGRRSIGNRKERQNDATMRVSRNVNDSPVGCQSRLTEARRAPRGDSPMLQPISA